MKLIKLAPNFHKLLINNNTIWFSYETPIAFYHWAKEHLYISQNEWGTTTGKHLNMINPDKSIRIPSNEVGFYIDAFY